MVFIPFGEEIWPRQRPGHRVMPVSDNGLLEMFRGQTSDGKYVAGIVPTDEFCEWLTTYCPSWATVEEYFGRAGIFAAHKNKGVALGFTDARDAVLTKLKWSGL